MPRKPIPSGWTSPAPVGIPPPAARTRVYFAITPVSWGRRTCGRPIAAPPGGLVVAVGSCFGRTSSWAAACGICTRRRPPPRDPGWLTEVPRELQTAGAPSAGAVVLAGPCLDWHAPCLSRARLCRVGMWLAWQPVAAPLCAVAPHTPGFPRVLITTRKVNYHAGSRARTRPPTRAITTQEPKAGCAHDCAGQALKRMRWLQ